MRPVLDINSISSSEVFIAGTSSILADLFPAEFVADKYYPRHLCPERINILAKRASKKFGIKEKAISIDMDRIPELVLKDKRNHPLAWCVSIIQDLTRHFPIDEIGYLGVAYNTSLHKDNRIPARAFQGRPRRVLLRCRSRHARNSGPDKHPRIYRPR